MYKAKTLRAWAWGMIGIVGCMAATAGETQEYTGRVYADRTSTLLPLGNGTGVMSIQVSGISTMSGNPPSVFLMRCAGLGLVDAEGKAASDVYCTFDESDNDTFDVKGKLVEGEGMLEVIGGSGRFAGATGSGKFQRTSTDGDKSAGIIQVKVKTK
ncbi:MAG: hypothetical protein A3H91_03560 [Gammaproteobacteria bacterium RIFCSPLOWO2_02_FULL_61_13]|nr:MAG: hypothetical protein A3H91_03560 [Gammaproteobacteria bacterium RIFCSPLOWO2_02_FULL_61_13]